MSKNINNMLCNNCGKLGHQYYKCIFPIASYGIILFRKKKSGTFEYLLICRKNSFGYIDFIRGKYSISNKDHIIMMIDEMSNQEKKNIVTMTFEELWDTIWYPNKSEFKHAKDKFLTLRDNIDLEFTLNDCLLESTTNWEDPEWGFPKGRRNNREKDFDCARREFREETGITNKLKFIENIEPFQEIFIGSNQKGYMHTYYIASLENDTTMNNFQKSEVSKMEWMTHKKAINKIRSSDIDKLKVINHLDKLLTMYILI